MAGATTQADRQAQVLAAGYNGPMTDAAVNQAYANAATPADLASSGISNTPQGGNSGPGQSASDPSTGQSFAQAVTAAATPFSQATSGVTAADLAEKKRQFDAQLEWTKQMWAQQGLPQLQIQQQAAALAQQEFDSQKQIAAQNFQLATTTQADTNANNVAGLTGYYNAPGATGAGGGVNPAPGTFVKKSNNEVGQVQSNGQIVGFGSSEAATAAGVAPGWTNVSSIPDQQFDQLVGGPPGQQTLAGQQQQATLSGQYNGAPTEAARQFNATQAQQQSQFGATTGLDYLKTAASLGGPADYFQQSNFLRGASANPAVPTFLNSLATNTGMPAFNAPSGVGGAPAVQSMSSLSGGLTGAGTGGAAAGTDPALSAIGKIGAAGGQALAPQAWESMNPDEQALFSSGMKASGYSMPTFLASYANSRIGQGAAQAA